MAKKRVYKKGAPGSEYDAYQGKPEQVKRRSQRNAARREAEKKGLVKKGDGLEVDHKAKNRKGPLDNGNVQILTKKKNRSKQPKRNGSQD